MSNQQGETAANEAHAVERLTAPENPCIHNFGSVRAAVPAIDDATQIHSLCVSSLIISLILLHRLRPEIQFCLQQNGLEQREMDPLFLLEAWRNGYPS